MRTTAYCSPARRDRPRPDARFCGHGTPRVCRLWSAARRFRRNRRRSACGANGSQRVLGSMPGVATMRDDDRAMLWRRQSDRIEHPADHMRRAHHQSGKHGDTCQYGNHRHNGSGQPSSSFAPVHLTPRFHISPRDIVAPTPLTQVIIGRAAVFGAFEGKNQGDSRHSFTTASHMRWIGRR